MISPQCRATLRDTVRSASARATRLRLRPMTVARDRSRMPQTSLDLKAPFAAIRRRCGPALSRL